MQRMLSVVMLIVVVCPGLLEATPASYMGKLAYEGAGADGILTVNSVGPENGWLSPVTSVSWQVDNTSTPGLWHYEYTITVQDGESLSADIQCVILETSSTFSWDDLASVSSTPSNWITSTEINSYSPWKNQNLPSTVYGLRFMTAAVDPTTLTIRFDSDRMPVWGDIYVRSFTADESYNTFANAGWKSVVKDIDPKDPPSNGSILDHILVPDSVGTQDGQVPAPGAIALGTLGASLAGWLQRRRRL